MANIFEIEFVGKERLVVVDNQLSIVKVGILRKRLKDVAKSLQDEMEELENKVKEIVKKFQSDLEPKGDETVLAYEDRVAPVKALRDAELKEITPEDKEAQLVTVAYSVLAAIADEFGQAHKVTRDGFDSLLWPDLKTKLAKFLLTIDCEIGNAFLPPKLK